MALSVVRGHHFEPGNLHELALERSSHIVGHRFRRGTRITHLDLNDRIIHCGQVAHRKSKICKYAKQDHRGGEGHSHYRAENERFREVHDRPLSPFFGCAAPDAGAVTFPPVSTCTLLPGRTINCPARTTRSPGASPLPITTSSP